ncbi:MAG TPA: LysR substrate-binding domain-containing protein [Candidatus Nanoarchaeia archaeon]|nr:LysR substrate-binding domain-containing protein [Candidatus Nanoarchaeia archaeon]
MNRLFMDLRYLRYFVVVAEEANFTHAAQRLHTVQPSLSRQIQRLEEIIGTPLFKRIKRDRNCLRLTEAGRVFLDQSRAILEQVDKAIDLARQRARDEAGHLSLGFIRGSEMKILSGILPTLKERHPEMKISHSTLSEADLLDALEEGDVQVAFLSGPVDSPTLNSEIILRHRLLVVLPNAHPLSKLRTIQLRRLADMTLIRPIDDDSRFVQILHSIAATEGVEFSSTIKHDNVLSALHSVGLGLGFALVPDYHSEILPRNIVALPLDMHPQPMLEIAMAHRKDDRTPALAYFLSTVRELVAPTLV